MYVRQCKLKSSKKHTLAANDDIIPETEVGALRALGGLLKRRHIRPINH